ncbi:urease accessory protein UreE [Rhodovibrionaceae bacterium A322]
MSLLRSTKILPAGSWSQEDADQVLLDYDQRHRRRITMVTRQGLRFLLDLPRPASLAQGDALVLEDGRLVAIEAAPEDLLQVTCDSPRHFLRIAWHLGNRHLPTEICEDRLYIRFDHVIEQMLQGLGAGTYRLSRAFQPEGGAYGSGQVLGHSHGSHSHAEPAHTGHPPASETSQGPGHD